MNWDWSNNNSFHSKMDELKDKREKLFLQCQRAGIPAKMGGTSRKGKRIKPSTISWMRRMLSKKGIMPSC